MTTDINKYTKFLEQVASEIDISPTKYHDAVNRYPRLSGAGWTMVNFRNVWVNSISTRRGLSD